MPIVWAGTVPDMKISRRTIVNSSLAVVAIGALVGGYFYIADPFSSATASTATQLTSTVQKGSVSSSITASGSIAPLSEVDANFAVSGTIATVGTSVGATVTAGQEIGTLDTTDLSAALTKAKTAYSNAKTTLANANSDLASAQASVAAGQGSSDQVSSAKSQVLTATSSVTDAASSVTTATENLASATLTAPISGLVVAVGGSVGARVNGGSSTATNTPALAATCCEVAPISWTVCGLGSYVSTFAFCVLAS